MISFIIFKVLYYNCCGGGATTAATFRYIMVFKIFCFDSFRKPFFTIFFMNCRHISRNSSSENLHHSYLIYNCLVWFKPRRFFPKFNHSFSIIYLSWVAFKIAMDFTFIVFPGPFFLPLKISLLLRSLSVYLKSELPKLAWERPGLLSWLSGEHLLIIILECII